MVVSCRVIAYRSIAFFRVANGFEHLHFVFAIVFATAVISQNQPLCCNCVPMHRNLVWFRC
jgi:hypothetical protein